MPLMFKHSYKHVTAVQMFEAGLYVRIADYFVRIANCLNRGFSRITRIFADFKSLVFLCAFCRIVANSQLRNCDAIGKCASVGCTCGDEFLKIRVNLCNLRKSAIQTGNLSRLCIMDTNKK